MCTDSFHPRITVSRSPMRPARCALSITDEVSYLSRGPCFSQAEAQAEASRATASQSPRWTAAHTLGRTPDASTMA